MAVLNHKSAVICASIISICSSYVNAQDLVCPNLYSDNANLVSLQDFDANDFCTGLARGLTESNVCINGESLDDTHWSIRVSRTMGGFQNLYRVFVLGPSDSISGYVPGGYELYEMEVVTFIGLNCQAAYYAVISRSMYHNGDRERAWNPRDHNWQLFYPDNIVSIRDNFMNHAGRYAVELMEGLPN